MDGPERIGEAEGVAALSVLVGAVLGTGAGWLLAGLVLLSG